MAEVTIGEFLLTLDSPSFSIHKFVNHQLYILKYLIVSKMSSVSKGVIPSVSLNQELLGLNTHAAGVYNLWLTIAVNSA